MRTVTPTGVVYRVAPTIEVRYTGPSLYWTEQDDEHFQHLLRPRRWMLLLLLLQVHGSVVPVDGALG